MSDRRLRTAQRFERWLASTGLRRRDVARILGCDPSYVTHLAAARMTPGLRLAAAIERASSKWASGPIKATEWAVEANEAA